MSAKYSRVPRASGAAPATSTDNHLYPEHEEEDDDDESKHEASLSLDESRLQAARERAAHVLTNTDIQSPIERRYSQQPKLATSSKYDSSTLLYTLLDQDQQVAPKLHYTEALDSKWSYHPRLGDLEKREITYLAPSKGGKQRHAKETRKEKLWFAKTGSTRKVFVSLKIKRISAIDNIKETFRMRFHIYLNWIMREEEYRAYLKHFGSKYYYEPVWTPDLEFMNAVEIHRLEHFEYPKEGKYKIETFKDFYVEKADDIVDKHEFDPQLCRFIRCKLECDITFAEELELQSFPFDVQDLSVIIRGNLLDRKIQYVFLPELREPNFGSIDTRYSVLDEWELSTAYIEFLGDKSGRARGREYPSINLRLKVKRKWKIYVINIVLLECALCGLSLCAFYLTHDQLGERLSLLITLILTSVAFSIVIQEKIPNVSYLTFLDKYILMSYFFLILIMVESVGVSTIDDDEKRDNYDHFLFYVFLVVWFVLLIVVFVIYAYRLIQTEEKKLLYSSDEVNDIVTQTTPTLVFDYKNHKRTGHGRRILSFMATLNAAQNVSVTDKDRERFARLQQKHEEFVQLQRALSMKPGESEDGQ